MRKLLFPILFGAALTLLAPARGDPPGYIPFYPSNNFSYPGFRVYPNGGYYGNWGNYYGPWAPNGNPGFVWTPRVIPETTYYWNGSNFYPSLRPRGSFNGRLQNPPHFIPLYTEFHYEP